MKNSAEEAAIRILSDYLEHGRYRRTPERFAVLKAVYSFKTHFSIQNLIDRMVGEGFAVSRGTVYNAIRLFMRLNLVVCHRLQDGIRYEACGNSGVCRRICTMCGREMDVRLTELDSLIDETRLKRFRKERYALYIYGVCSTCQAVMTRKKKKENNNKN